MQTQVTLCKCSVKYQQKMKTISAYSLNAPESGQAPHGLICEVSIMSLIKSL